MTIDLTQVKAKAKAFLHRLTLIAIGAAAGLSQTVTDKTQDYLEKTKDLPAIVAEESHDVLINTQEKADQAVTTIGKTAVKAGKKVDGAAKVVSKKIQDKLKPLDELGQKIGHREPPKPEPKPKPAVKPHTNFTSRSLL